MQSHTSGADLMLIPMPLSALAWPSLADLGLRPRRQWALSVDLSTRADEAIAAVL